MNDHLWDAGGEYLSKNVKSLCVYQSVTAEHMSLFAKFQYWGIHQHQRIRWDRENIMTKTIQQSLSKAQQTGSEADSLSTGRSPSVFLKNTSLNRFSLISDKL